MRIKIILSAFVGFVLGVAAMWLVIQKTTMKVFASQYLTGVMDQANVALQIRAGKQMQLLTNIETSLPQYVLAVSDGFRSNPDSTNALWMVKAYYQRNKLMVPAEIKAILDSLPPKPPTQCQIRLRALDKVVTNGTTPTPQN